MDHDQWVVQIKEWLQKIDDRQMTTDDVRRSILEYQKQCELNESISKELVEVAQCQKGSGC